MSVKLYYRTFKLVLRKIQASWLVLSWSRCCHTDWGNGHKLCIFFCFRSKSETFKGQVPFNKLLTKLVPYCVRSVLPRPSSGQYCPVRPSRSVSKRLLSEHRTRKSEWRGIILLRGRRLSQWREIHASKMLIWFTGRSQYNSAYQQTLLSEKLHEWSFHVCSSQHRCKCLRRHLQCC